jgi:diguanylate cyclase (GGDEF)-like protein
MIDVDYFKQYNDHYGHAMGDLTLQKIATALASVLWRPADLIARYGGEEFVMLLPDTDAVGGKFIADRSLELIIELDIPHDFSQVAKMVSVSIGLATINMDLDNQILPQFFLETADHNLYQAKQGGRNQVVGSVLGHSFPAE